MLERIAHQARDASVAAPVTPDRVAYQSSTSRIHDAGLSASDPRCKVSSRPGSTTTRSWNGKIDSALGFAEMIQARRASHSPRRSELSTAFLAAMTVGG